MIRLLFAIIVTLTVAGTLSACGKKGPPTLPEGQEDDYPRVYPPPSEE